MKLRHILLAFVGMFIGLMMIMYGLMGLAKELPKAAGEAAREFKKAYNDTTKTDTLQ